MTVSELTNREIRDRLRPRRDTPAGWVTAHQRRVTPVEKLRADTDDQLFLAHASRLAALGTGASASAGVLLLSRELTRGEQSRVAAVGVDANGPPAFFTAVFAVVDGAVSGRRLYRGASLNAALRVARDALRCDIADGFAISDTDDRPDSQCALTRTGFAAAVAAAVAAERTMLDRAARRLLDHIRRNGLPPRIA